MDILFNKNKDAKICNEDALLRKAFKGNPRRYQLIRVRLDELADAENLSIMRLIPQTYCHELKGKRKGQIAVKLDQGYRLVFEPANKPVPTKPDGGIEWAQVTAVRILKLAEDYHE
jgi:plasmid maintenance system killer protein